MVASLVTTEGEELPDPEYGEAAKSESTLSLKANDQSKSSTVKASQYSAFVTLIVNAPLSSSHTACVIGVKVAVGLGIILTSTSSLGAVDTDPVQVCVVLLIPVKAKVYLPGANDVVGTLTVWLPEPVLVILKPAPEPQELATLPPP